METIKKILLSSLALLFCNLFQLYATPTISSSVSATDLVCPGTSVRYEVNYPTGFSQCQVTWTMVDGSGNFSSSTATSNPVFIIWADQNPNKVKMQVVVKYLSSSGSCSSPEETTLTFTHILNSVFSEQLQIGDASVDVPYCPDIQPIVSLIVGHMYIKNTGLPGQL